MIVDILGLGDEVAQADFVHVIYGPDEDFIQDISSEPLGAELTETAENGSSAT